MERLLAEKKIRITSHLQEYIHLILPGSTRGYFPILKEIGNRGLIMCHLP